MGAHDFGDHTVFTRGDNEAPVEWGFNCLTGGIHHGRPEKLWTTPLLQATMMFRAEHLKDLVLARIHTDALIMVHRLENKPERITEEWANAVKVAAEDRYDWLLHAKVSEIREYYASPTFLDTVNGVVARTIDNRLNPHFEPLHLHDTINMFCRILGCTSERATH